MCVQRENAHEERGSSYLVIVSRRADGPVGVGDKYADSSSPIWIRPPAQGILPKNPKGDEKQSQERKGGYSLRGQSDCIDRISRKGRQVGAKAGCFRRGRRLDVSADMCVHVFVYKILKEKVLEQDGCQEETLTGSWVP